MVNDRIADMLTRIRNANQMKYSTVEVLGSKMTLGIAEILKREGYIVDFNYEKGNKGDKLTITLKYAEKKERVITGLKRISKPGLRVYVKASEVPRVLNGQGIAILSTPNGIITNKEAKKQNIGGEVLAFIW